MDEITSGMVDDFKAGRLLERRWSEDGERTVGNATVNRALSTLRLLFNYAERCGYQVPNPVKGIEFLDEGSGRMRIISLEEEIAYMIAASQPLKDVARIILETGMRPEEVFRIELANLDFTQRTIFNPFGKTPAARRKLTMTEEVWCLLKYRAVNGNGVYAFSSPDDSDRPIGSVRKGHDAAVRRSKIRPPIPALRSQAHVRNPGSDGRSGSPDSRGAARAHKHSDDDAIRTSRRGAQEGSGKQAREF
jgi:integrase